MVDWPVDRVASNSQIYFSARANLAEFSFVLSEFTWSQSVNFAIICSGLFGDIETILIAARVYRG